MISENVYILLYHRYFFNEGRNCSPKKFEIRFIRRIHLYHPLNYLQFIGPSHSTNSYLHWNTPISLSEMKSIYLLFLLVLPVVFAQNPTYQFTLIGSDPGNMVQIGSTAKCNCTLEQPFILANCRYYHPIYCSLYVSQNEISIYALSDYACAYCSATCVDISGSAYDPTFFDKFSLLSTSGANSMHYDDIRVPIYVVVVLTWMAINQLI
jgi:hypothetical protein